MIYRSIYQLKPFKDQCLSPLAKWLMENQISANHVTLSGLLLGLFAAGFIMMNYFGWGIILILVSVFADLLDGTLARLQRATDGLGKYLDAVSDRLVESSWVMALVFCGKLPWWAYFLPVGSVLLLIARSVAYHQGLETSFVTVTRFERTAVIIGSLVIPWLMVMNVLLSLVIIGTLFSGLNIFKVLWFNRKFEVEEPELLNSNSVKI